jgi:hypothetical protein
MRSLLTVLAALLLLLLLLLGADPAVADRPAPASGVWPLSPRPSVTAGFDPPASRWGSGHRGVDLAGTAFQLVHASLAGRVSFARGVAGRGVVVVDHGSTRTTYEPVSATVSVGDRVAMGAVLGRLQLVGSHCFPRWCLHWGLVEGAEQYLDPLVLVGAVPVRLLPLAPGPTPLSAPGPASAAGQGAAAVWAAAGLRSAAASPSWASSPAPRWGSSPWPSRSSPLAAW